MDWSQTLTIIATLLGVTAWLDHRHRQGIDKMNERVDRMDDSWRELFERMDDKLNEIKWR